MKTPRWFEKLNAWVEGESPGLPEPQAHREKDAAGNALIEEAPAKPFGRGSSLLGGSSEALTRVVPAVAGILCCAIFCLVMLATVAYLPRYENPENPMENEVAQRYIEEGIEEVGAVNLVTNIILVYRGFDTYGESCVLFLGATAVILLLSRDKHNTTEEDLRVLAEADAEDEISRNQILGHISAALLPILLLYGLYILVNGHLSPGGGFAGGSMLGGALILCENAYGYRRVGKFFNRRLMVTIQVVTLLLYAALICSMIYNGANGIPEGIPLGTPGSIFSGGFMVPKNLAVGMVVASTMYGFYSYFGRGDL
ncbi:MAG: hypothetical protein K5707_09755 [Clostridia bacterium]|nr:hypothetical protein [Clostridia bacterium]